MSILGLPTKPWMYDNPGFLPEPAKYLICGGLATELKKLQRALLAQVAALESDIQYLEDLMNMPFKTVKDTLDDLNSMFQGLDNVVPNIANLDSIQAIQDFVNSCLFLKDHPLLSDYYKLAQDFLNKYQEQFKIWVDDQKGTLPTFEITDWFKTKVVDKMNKFLMFEKIQDFNKILACMNAICTLDENDNPVGDLVDEVENNAQQFKNLKDRLRILPESENMNKDDFFKSIMNKAATNAGLDPKKKLILNESLKTYEQTEQKFNESYENIVQAMKNIKEGESWDNDLPYVPTAYNTHYNTPTIISTSTTFDTIYGDSIIDTYVTTWTNEFSTLEYPSGTTNKKDSIDVYMDINYVNIVETKDPEVNCFTTYYSNVEVAIGNQDAFVTWSGVSDEITYTVEHIGHGIIDSGDPNYVILDECEFEEIEGKHQITIIDEDHYSFVADNTFVDSTGEYVKAYKIFHTGQGEHSVGLPARSKCGEYDAFGLTDVNTDELTYIRRYMSEAISNAIENAMSEFTALEIEGQIPY